MEKTYTIKENTTVAKCPKCDNNTHFKCKSEQVAEDCCAVWAVCGKCGFDSSKGNSDYRVEDVWGDCSFDGLCVALSVWNDNLKEYDNIPNNF